MKITTSTSRTALRLLIATPLAVSAIALGGFSDLAHADTPGHEPTTGGTISLPGDDEDPRPEGPGEITNPEGDDDPQPEGPGDITNPEGDDDPQPDGPDDITNPEGDDDPQPDGPDDLTNPEPGDGPEDVPGDEPADQGDDKGGNGGGGDNVGGVGGVDEVDGSADVPVPNRIDAGVGPVAAADEQDLTLTWVLAGGGLVVAAGSLLARQRVATRTR